MVALHRDGRELTVDISLVSAADTEGTCAVAVLRSHARADVEEALRERLDFEALITNITAAVVVATPQTIDQALLDALERLRSAVGVDRAVFLEYRDDWTEAIITHVAYGEGVPTLPERRERAGSLPLGGPAPTVRRDGRHSRRRRTGAHKRS